MTERLRGVPLAEYRKICIKNLKIQSGWTIESGSSSNAIVGDLVEVYGMDPEKAVKTMQEWERKAGFKRGKSD